jgi:DNA-binding IclR family transcriptional regulator
MTASELSDAAELPLSTTYRKLDLLSAASLLDERTEIREGGHHTTRYVIDFEAVRVAFDEDRDFWVSIARPARTADQTLADLWSEVRRET